MVKTENSVVITKSLGPEFGAILATLHQQCVAHGAWSSNSYQQMMGLHTSSALIAMVDQEPVGFLLSSSTSLESEILMLCIAPKVRRLGIGSKLLLSLVEDLAVQGTCDLLLEVAEDNHEAINLYGKNGFLEVGKRPNYYESPEGKKTSALIMKRIIT